jgi:clan AA aspartic protease (TIGR02281 family)
MICPNCHKPVEPPSHYCPGCGVGLPRGGGRILVATAALVLAILIGAYGYVKYQLYQGRAAADRTALHPAPTTASSQRANAARPEASEMVDTSAQPPPVIRADFTFNDITGHERLNFPVAVMASGWFAFPKRPCIGGYTWRVGVGNGRPLEVQGGIQRDADPVGLWQVPLLSAQAGPELMPWQPDQPLAWYPLNGARVGRRVLAREVEHLGDFARIPFKSGDAGPGIFVQNGRVVGWSFADLLAGGYLWLGNPGAELIPEFYTEDFYRLTFANGREEALLLALADESLTDLKRLEALTQAYRLAPRLTESEIPEDIRPAPIHTVMRNLIHRIQDQGQADDLLPLFDAAALQVLDDPALAADLVAVARNTGRYADALKLIDSLPSAGAEETETRRSTDAMQTALYREWLNQLILDDNFDAAREVYQEAQDRLPQDSAIHLTGVELALQGQNWALAEKLLAAQSYPPELRDKVNRLQQDIADLKALAGKIVIRFPPGSPTIPVVARLKRGLTQRFIIDTGASMVTVPAATANRLGIDLAYDLPRRLFYSATGVHNAAEVTLPAIELNGWVIKDVRALVVDLPGQPGVGLLGMNYLSNFNLDLDTSEGLLLMAPR